MEIDRIFGEFCAVDATTITVTYNRDLTVDETKAATADGLSDDPKKAALKAYYGNPTIGSTPIVVESAAVAGKVATLTVTEMTKEGKITVNGVETTTTPDYRAAAVKPALDGAVAAESGSKDVTFKLDKAVVFDATSPNNEITVNGKAATVAVDEDNLAFTVTFTDTNVEEVGVDTTGGEFTITLDGDADTKPATYTVKVAVPTEIGKFAVTITPVI